MKVKLLENGKFLIELPSNSTAMVNEGHQAVMTNDGIVASPHTILKVERRTGSLSSFYYMYTTERDVSQISLSVAKQFFDRYSIYCSGRWQKII
jgi:hypothetical protein